MTLRFAPTIDPRSEAAKRAPIDAIPFASSPERETLSQLLFSYLEGQVTGESILVSGHRGAGKTTLVWNAIEQVRKDWQGKSLITGYRDGPVDLLPVALDGPDLLPWFATKQTRGDAQLDSNTRSARPTGVSENEENDDDVTLFLRRLVTGLYFRFSERVSESMQRFASEQFDKNRHGNGETLEIANHIGLELDTAPLPDVLRDYWSRLRLLHDGILFPKDPPFFRGGRPRHDQGTREVAALSTMAVAYQKVIGDLEQRRSTDDKLTAEQHLAEQPKAGKESDKGLSQNVPASDIIRALTASRSSGTSTSASETIKELTPALFGLLAGGLGALLYVMKSDSSDTFTAVATVVGAILTSMFGARLITQATQKRSRTDHTTLKIDSRPETLVRDFPRIISRLTNSGLLPVFVIDELDKLKDLSCGLETLMHHIKGLANDRAFFLFLTDRDYFDHVRQIDKTSSYALSRTYFSQRLFVAYRPGDVWRFLLGSVRQEPASEQDPESLSEEAEARCALPFYIMHAARMHPFHVRDELLGISGDNAIVRLDGGPGVVLTENRYLASMNIQLAILLVLRKDDDLFGRLRQDSYFLQQVYDAAYYPSREWRKGKDCLDISEKAFKAYMIRRVDPEYDDRCGDRKNWDTSRMKRSKERHVDGETSWLADLELTESDFLLLLETMQQVVRYIADPEALCKEWDALEQYEPSMLLNGNSRGDSDEQAREKNVMEDERFQLIPQVPSQVVESVREAFASKNPGTKARPILESGEATLSTIENSVPSIKSDTDDPVWKKLQQELKPANRYLWRINEFGGPMRGAVADKVKSLQHRSYTREGKIEEIDSVDEQLQIIQDFFDTLRG